MAFRPKAVLFDLDGTLIDTEKYYRRYWPQSLAHFGYEMTDQQALTLRSLGRPFAPALLKKWYGEDFDYYKIREYRKGLVEEAIRREGITVKPGARELLAFLKNEGILRAVTTASDVERTTRFLGSVGLADSFDRFCSAADAPEGKPSPDVYLMACRQLEISPSEALAVEDAPNGILSAHRAGCRVIFVPDQTKEEPEVEPLCFAKVDTLADIIPLLREDH